MITAIYSASIALDMDPLALTIHRYDTRTNLWSYSLSEFGQGVLCNDSCTPKPSSIWFHSSFGNLFTLESCGLDDFSLRVPDGLAILVHIDLFHFGGISVKVFTFHFDVRHGVWRGCTLSFSTILLLFSFPHRLWYCALVAPLLKKRDKIFRDHQSSRITESLYCHMRWMDYVVDYPIRSGLAMIFLIRIGTIWTQNLELEWKFSFNPSQSFHSFPFNQAGILRCKRGPRRRSLHRAAFYPL